MPFINVKTNADLTQERMENIKSELGNAITVFPGKSESWLMVAIEDKVPMWFKGKSERTIVYAEVKIFANDITPSIANAMTAEMTEILSAGTGASPSDIYITYSACKDWGWNGGNF